MITKLKENGAYKRRLVVDCRRSGVNAATVKAERLQLPRAIDVMTDALWLASRPSSASSSSSSFADTMLSWFGIDFRDAFYMIPMRRAEQRHYAIAHQGKWYLFAVTAMGSANGPAIWGRVVSVLARVTQAVLW
eukprot:6467143-Amphidinium_carterae.1